MQIQCPPMHPLSVEPLGAHQVREAAGLIVEAFRTEPFTAYQMDMEREEARRRFPAAVEVIIESLLIAGHAPLAATDVSAGRLAGVALVKGPPGAGHKPALGEIAGVVLPRLPAILGLLPLYRPRSLRVLAITPPPRLPRAHYYLTILAVAPADQGQGVGRRLLEVLHETADADRSAAGVYLQTGLELSREYYARFGYRTLRAGSVGPLTCYHMFRPRLPSAGWE